MTTVYHTHLASFAYRFSLAISFDCNFSLRAGADSVFWRFTYLLHGAESFL